MSLPFVHLRLHSEYSVVDGLVRLDAAAAAAAADGQGALALTDSGNLFGAVRFYKAARAQGVKPIIGVDAWISNDRDRESPHRLLLLAMDRCGYRNLCELASRSWIGNAHRGRAEMRLDWFEESGDGLIALSGAAAGEIGVHLAVGNEPAARASAARLAQLFPQRFYIEVQRAGHAGDESLVRASARLAIALDLPLAATHPVQFIAREDFRAHEARVCIAEGYTLADPRRPRRFTEEQYFKRRAEMAALFADMPAALANTAEIARRCNLELELGTARLPDFPTPPGVTIEAHCRDLAQQGLQARLRSLYPDPLVREANRERYQARLDVELKVIGEMGFAGYFLIVADFINWAKGNGIPVGPGRGSGAGSLVAYALAITDLDPLKYDLLFERFLNPERVSMPDFDIDFCQDKRDRVIDYVRRKYGAEAVSQIATFGTLGAKAVVRDVGRVLDLPYSKCDQLSKLIPHNPADPWTLDRALAQEPAFAEAVAGDEEYAQIVELARPLEGLTRNVGMHAGGVLIAPGRLTDFCPLYAAGGEAAVISQFDKDDIEAIGLVKFDFLGLTTLTILNLTLRFVRALDPSSTLTLETLPLDDAATYDVFKKANTAAIFQFESRGMRELLKRAQPDRLEDLIALNALYRPGPMDLIPDFVERKHGRQRIEYLHAALEPILAETYGIMVYQEQVMRIAQVVGGYSLGGADILRRAMGKKKPEEMAKQRAVFIDGAAGQGATANVATQLYDLMEKFAGYGFNKSHSAAYALLAYQTAYFKAHYPSAFMAANLSAVLDETDKVKELVEDSRAIGLRILGPDINLGNALFEPVDERTIRYGLGAVKGTGSGAIQHIVAVREAGGPFTDLFDFCARVDKQHVNRRVAEALVRAGAFDALDANRAKLAASVGRALEAAEHASAHAGQSSLFGDVIGEAKAAAEYVPSKPWSERERLANEKLALGFYFSGHLFTEFAEEARRLAPMRLVDLSAAPLGRDVRLAGIIVSARTMNSPRGRRGIVVLDDGTAQLELTIFAELYDRKRSLLREDTLVFVSGRVRYEDFRERVTLNVDDVTELAEARARASARLRIEVDGQPDLARFRSALVPFRIANGVAGGGCRVVVHYRNGFGSVDLLLPEEWRVRPEQSLLDDLKQQPKVRAAEFRYGPA